MRLTTLGTAALVSIALTGGAITQDDPPLHTEKGLRNQLVIEETQSLQYLIRDDKYILNDQGQRMLAGKYEYRRFVMGGILHGTQAHRHDRHILDDFQLMTAANPWENIACLGAIQRFDMRDEPLTYHHRTGPIGAIYSELRTRKGGADAKAPVAVFGLTAGTQACYALRGQTMTFYEADPVVKKLVADTDKYFSYVSDARKRGAEIEIRLGDKRAKLKEDKDRKYALVVVDTADSFPFNTDIFTKEAVQEYLNRLTDDGIIALHISNKYLRFEPMFAQMAEELKLTARLWNDDAESRHGKTASSWLVLARSKRALGARLCSPISDLMVEYPYTWTLMDVMVRTYPDLKRELAKAPVEPQETMLKWLDARTNDPQAAQFAAWIRKHKSEYVTLMELLRAETGYGFRPAQTLPAVTAWTDARADIFILWMNPQLQAVRRFFGYPTPIER